LAVAAVLARTEAMDETDRNMFLGNRLALTAQEFNKQLNTRQRVSGSGDLMAHR